MKPSLLIGEDTHRDIASVLAKYGRLVISGASNQTAKALLFSHLLSFRPMGGVIVTDGEEDVEGWEHWLKFFESPVPPLHLAASHAVDGEVQLNPLQQFLLLMRGEEKMFLMTRDVWEAEFPLYTELERRKLTLTINENVAFTAFIEDLIERGYEHGDDVVLSPGQYRRTGDTVEIFPIQSALPYRVEFRFDNIERIH